MIQIKKVLKKHKIFFYYMNFNKNLNFKKLLGSKNKTICFLGRSALENNTYGSNYKEEKKGRSASFIKTTNNTLLKRHLKKSEAPLLVYTFNVNQQNKLPLKKIYTAYSKLSEMKYVSIDLSSSERIRQWAEKQLPNGKIIGEVLSPDTLHHKTFKPKKGGLFCESIFGPLKDFECSCGKKQKPTEDDYQKILQHSQTSRKYCPVCDVEYTWSIIRRYQLGYIRLALPVSHIWYLKANPSYMSLILGIKRRNLEKILYASNVTTLQYFREKAQNPEIEKSPKQLFKTWQQLKNNSTEEKINMNFNFKDVFKVTEKRKRFEYEFNLENKKIVGLHQKCKPTISTQEFIFLKIQRNSLKKFISIFSIKLWKKIYNHNLLFSNKKKHQKLLQLLYQKKFLNENQQKINHMHTALGHKHQNNENLRVLRPVNSFFYNYLNSNSQTVKNSTINPKDFKIENNKKKGRSSIFEFTKNRTLSSKKFSILNFLTNNYLIFKSKKISKSIMLLFYLDLFRFIEFNFLKVNFSLTKKSEAPLLVYTKSGNQQKFDYKLKKKLKNIKSKNDIENFLNTFFSLNKRDQTMSTLFGKIQSDSLLSFLYIYFLKKEPSTPKRILFKNKLEYNKQLKSALSFKSDKTLIKQKGIRNIYIYKYCVLKKTEKIQDFHFLNSEIQNLLKTKTFKFKEFYFAQESSKKGATPLSVYTKSGNKKLLFLLKNKIQESILHILQKKRSAPSMSEVQKLLSLYLLNSKLNYRQMNLLLKKIIQILNKQTNLLTKELIFYLLQIFIGKEKNNKEIIIPKGNVIKKNKKDNMNLLLKYFKFNIINKNIFNDFVSLRFHINLFLKNRYFLEEKMILSLKKRKKKQSSLMTFINNIYVLSYREILENERNWKYFGHFVSGSHNYIDNPMSYYNNRILRLYGLSYEKMGTSLCGGTIIKALLNELKLDELKKLMKQNYIIIAECNTNIKLLTQEFEYIVKKSEFIELRKELQELTNIRDNFIRQTKIIAKTVRRKSDLTSMILTNLPVLPPDLRPILKLQNQLAASDLNRLYQRVLYRNDRVKKFLKDPAISQSFEMKYAQRLLQEAVDNLIQNGKGGTNPEKDSRGRILKSLSENLKGKQGRFRQYLLGKRVDYSGRSVIVVGPKLKIYECGLPKEMAFELFLPFLIKKILHYKYARTVIGAKSLIKLNQTLSIRLLYEVMQNYPILLNRAPTLHRLGFQAFQPKLIEGRAILLHPLVCPAFNADFDGDQMAVHIPLTVEARAETWKLMFSRNNMMSPATGEPILLPSQDMVLGCYYLTTEVHKKYIQDLKSKKLKGALRLFSSLEKALIFYQLNRIKTNTTIWVKYEKLFEYSNELTSPLEIRLNCYGNWQDIRSKYYKQFNHANFNTAQYIRTTPGRILLNKTIQKSILS